MLTETFTLLPWPRRTDWRGQTRLTKEDKMHVLKLGLSAIVASLLAACVALIAVNMLTDLDSPLARAGLVIAVWALFMFFFYRRAEREARRA